MKIAFGQIDSVVGDIVGNTRKIIAVYRSCVKKGAELVVFPELCITGYPPEDLLLRNDFIQKEQNALRVIIEQSGKVPMVLGATRPESERLYNAAYLIYDKKYEIASLKTNLPNYGVFDEYRYFSQSYLVNTVKINGVKTGVMVCEDFWTSDKAASLKSMGAKLLVVINASPYEAAKLSRRYELAHDRAKETGLPVVYVNAVGGQDELVFDGGSFITDVKGNILLSAPEFEEFAGIPKKRIRPLPVNETRYWAMVLGLKDYVHKNGFGKVVLGLSGGIDSALVATIAADALGAENVRAVMLPSEFTSKESIADAKKLAKNLRVKLQNIPIEAAYEAFGGMLKPAFKGRKKDITEENLQSRIRGVALMALSNKFGELLLTTGNKSEIAVGYSTLYGDSCGAFNPIKDLYKTDVYEVARWRNKKSEVIPERVFTKAPSAELRHGQTDQDSLPPYETLDTILRAVVDNGYTAEECAEHGFEEETVERVMELLKSAEYKRRQAAPGVKLSAVAFGRDWRMPLTNKG